MGNRSRPGRRGYTLGLLLAVFAVSFMDRQILAVLAPSLQRELGLSDTQLGLLSGLAFALFFTALGVPLAVWADRRGRVALIAGSVAAFSVMTAVTGLASSFLFLLLARIGVAAGEAGTSPASHSLIADLYPPRERSSAMALFALGPQLGLVLGFAVGGGLDQAFGWRWAFLGAALPGFVVAALVAATMREPPRGGAGARAAPVPVAATLARIGRNRALRHLFVGGGLASAVGYGVFAWLPMFLTRSHGMTSAAAGGVLALVVGVAGAAGTLAGGRLADRWAAGDPRWPAGVPALALACSAPAWVAAFAASLTGLALGLLVLPGILTAVYVGPTLALVQTLADARERAVAAALFLFFANLIGLGCGPLAVGVASDLLAPRLGSDALRWAMTGLAAVGLWAAAHYLAAARALVPSAVPAPPPAVGDRHGPWRRAAGRD